VGELHVAGSDGLEELLRVAESRGVPVVDDPARRLHPVADVAAGRNDDGVILQVGT
jgi:hypothetical protein